MSIDSENSSASAAEAPATRGRKPIRKPKPATSQCARWGIRPETVFKRTAAPKSVALSAAVLSIANRTSERILQCDLQLTHSRILEEAADDSESRVWGPGGRARDCRSGQNVDSW